jgi:RNA polymerase sigma factor (sigma-70 family)
VARVVPYVVRSGGSRVDQLPDEGLLAGFGAGDPEISTAFVRKFQAKVFGIALAVVGDPRAAEDVAQSAFERAWRHARTFDPRRGSVSSWLSAIVRNLAIDTVRVRPIMPIDVTELMGALTAEPAGASDPERAVVDGEAAAALRTALRRLPANQARAIVLAGIGGLSASQVALSEGIALGTAKTRIRTAMLRLRASMLEARSEHA